MFEHFSSLQVLARAVVPSLVRSLKHPKSAERTPLQWLEDARKEQFEQTGSVHGLLTYRSWIVWKTTWKDAWPLQASFYLCVWMILYRSGEFWMCCIIFFIFWHRRIDVCWYVSLCRNFWLPRRIQLVLRSLLLSHLLLTCRPTVMIFCLFWTWKNIGFEVCLTYLYFVIFLAIPCLLMQASWDFEICRW